MHQISAEMRDCITNCLECYRACEETLSHCLTLGGEHTSPKHIGMLADCAKICDVSANFMMRSSDQHAKVCGVCAEICLACAKDCEQMANGDQQMLDCAAACRKCAESCQAMAKYL